MLFVIFDSKGCVCSCESTRVTPCNILFLSSANLQWWSSFGTRPDGRQLCFCVSHLMLFFSLSKTPPKKTVRWYLADSRLWGRAPGSTRAPAVSKGEERHDVSASISSRLAPSKAKVSDQISLYNRQDEKQQPQSDAACTLGHNGATYACCFQQWLRNFSMQWKQSWRAWKGNPLQSQPLRNS